MGFGALRVINEDRVKPAQGFGTHQHQDMEIISYVVNGALEHKDSMGTGSIIRPGEIQRMSAGTGVAHSEFNASKQEEVHFLQIWIIPSKTGLKPSYEQKSLPLTKMNELLLIGSPDGGPQAITIHQDVNLYICYLTKNGAVNYTFQKGRKGWIQVIKGEISLNGLFLNPGDGVQVTNENHIEIKCISDGEFLFFDLK